MNWGYRIALLYIGFVIFIIALVVGTHTISIDLVAKDYYKQELAYQNQIDRLTNTSKLATHPTIQYDSIARYITLQLPVGVVGELLFFRPNKPSLDFKIPLLLDEAGKQILPTQNLEKGVWRLKINWTQAGKEYYLEHKIKISRL